MTAVTTAKTSTRHNQTMTKSDTPTGTRSDVTGAAAGDWAAASDGWAMQYALDCMPYGVFLVDDAAGVVVANACGRQILAAADALVLRNDRLAARSETESQTLHAAIAAAARPVYHWEEDECVPMTLSRRPPLPPLPAVVKRLRARQGAAAAAVWLGYPASAPAADPEILMALYHLTAAEARLTVDLLAGRGLAGAAGKNRVGPNTARTQLKRIFEKTGTHRQAELVGLVLRSAAMLRLTIGDSI